MEIRVISAHSPHWLDATHSRLQLTVLFSHLADAVAFTASATDVERYGRDLFANAVAGEFGPIAEYVAPTPYTIANDEHPPLRQQRLAQARAMVQHWDILGDTTQIAAWRDYYRALYALAECETWPMVDEWPLVPDSPSLV
ncbi:MAG: hypothetical protein ACRCYK_05075 [Aeromonas hydrophila]